MAPPLVLVVLHRLLGQRARLKSMHGIVGLPGCKEQVGDPLINVHHTSFAMRAPYAPSISLRPGTNVRRSTGLAS